jgi:hypothetical protein
VLGAQRGLAPGLKQVGEPLLRQGAVEAGHAGVAVVGGYIFRGGVGAGCSVISVFWVFKAVVYFFLNECKAAPC